MIKKMCRSVVAKSSSGSLDGRIMRSQRTLCLNSLFSEDYSLLSLVSLMSCNSCVFDGEIC